jgi:hypothetical protein
VPNLFTLDLFAPTPEGKVALVVLHNPPVTYRVAYCAA